MRLRRVLACLAASVAALAPAQAQMTGSRMGHNLGEKDGAAAMEVVADCVASRRPDLVRRWFQLLPGSHEESVLLGHEEGDFSVCLDTKELAAGGKEVIFHASSLRLPVARAAVRGALRGASAQSPAAPDSDPWFIKQLDRLGTAGEGDRTYLAMLDFGHCVAVHDWPDAIAFLRAKPQSPAEAAAIKQLVPVLGPCLPANSQIAVTTVNLRDMLAEPVLHLARGWDAAPIPPATSTQPSTRK